MIGALTLCLTLRADGHFLTMLRVLVIHAVGTLFVSSVFKHLNVVAAVAVAVAAGQPALPRARYR